MEQEQTMVMTLSGLATFLSQIEELQGLDITSYETETGWEIQVGENTYTVESPVESDVEVSDEVVEDIVDIDETGWQAVENGELGDVSIEGGILKEIVKTLAIGGLVRLTKNALTKS
jgi:hypothetical protein